MSAHEHLAELELAARELEAFERRRVTLETIDQIISLADTLDPAIRGTLNFRLRDQVIGACLAAKATFPKEKK